MYKHADVKKKALVDGPAKSKKAGKKKLAATDQGSSFHGVASKQRWRLNYGWQRQAMRPEQPDQGGHRPVEEARAAFASHGLPPTLVPDTLVGFKLDPDSGRFVLRLSERLTLPVKNGFKILFDREIRGRLDHKALRDLSGVHGQKWVAGARIDRIEIEGAHLKFNHADGQAELPLERLHAFGAFGGIN